MIVGGNILQRCGTGDFIDVRHGVVFARLAHTQIHWFVLFGLVFDNGINEKDWPLLERATVVVFHFTFDLSHFRKMGFFLFFV